MVLKNVSMHANFQFVAPTQNVLQVITRLSVTAKKASFEIRTLFVFEKKMNVEMILNV